MERESLSLSIKWVHRQPRGSVVILKINGQRVKGTQIGAHHAVVHSTLVVKSSSALEISSGPMRISKDRNWPCCGCLTGRQRNACKGKKRVSLCPTSEPSVPTPDHPASSSHNTVNFWEYSATPCTQSFQDFPGT